MPLSEKTLPVIPLNRNSVSWEDPEAASSVSKTVGCHQAFHRLQKGCVCTVHFVTQWLGKQGLRGPASLLLVVFPALSRVAMSVACFVVVVCFVILCADAHASDGAVTLAPSSALN